MTQPSRFWRIAASLFVFINVGGAILAFAQGENMHAEVHLALLGIAIVGYAFMRAAVIRKQHVPPAELDDGRVEYLQQSVDALALEVERLGEKQRFNEKLQAERKEPPDGP